MGFHLEIKAFKEDGQLADPRIQERQLDRVHEYLRDVLSGGNPNTYRAYIGDMRRFLRFCHSHHLNAFTGNEDYDRLVVKRFIDYILPLPAATLPKNAGIKARYKPSTIQRTLVVVGTIYRVMEHPNPLDDVLIRRTVNGRLQRVENRAPKQAGQWPVHAIRALKDFTPQTLNDLRNLCLVNIALDTLCRASELARIRYDDIDFERGILTVRETKTQKMKTELRLLSRTSLQLIQQLVEAYGFSRVGYLFVPIHRAGTPYKRYTKELHPDGINIVKREQPIGYHAILDGMRQLAEKVGIDPTMVSGHSLRVTGAVLQREYGASFQDIMKAGGWRSPAMVLRYTEEVDIKTSGAATLFDAMER